MELKTALVVDDSKVARFGLTKILENKGIKVETVASGLEAISYLEVQKPDIIFMDYFMPGMDGPDATRAIRENQNTTNIPIVMCTSKETERDQLQARSAGADGFIIKPATRKALDEVLNEIKLQHYEITTRQALEPFVHTPIDETPADEIEIENLPTSNQLEIDRVPPTQSAQFELEINQYVQSVCQNTVKKLADSIVPEMAETTASIIAEDISKAINEQLNQNLKSECENIARTIATETAKEISQEYAEQTTRDIAEKIATDVAETITIDSIRTLEKSIDGSIAYSLQQLVHNDAITEQLKAITHHHSVSIAENISRNIASEIADQTAREIALIHSEEIAERIVKQQLRSFKMIVGSALGFLTLLVIAILLS